MLIRKYGNKQWFRLKIIRKEIRPQTDTHLSCSRYKL
jgi:hypothetical protein